MVAQQNSRRGCRFWFNRVVHFVFFLGLGLGLSQYIKEQIWPPAPIPTAESKAGQGSKNTVVWEQSQEVRRQITPVSSEEYRPLQLPGNKGFGFVFALPNGMALAASSRGGATGPPSELLSEGKTYLSLDTRNVLTQRHSYIQLVTAIATKADMLSFDPDGILEPGEAMFIIPAKGPPIGCTLELSKPHSLKTQAKKFKLNRTGPDISGKLSGCPVVFRKNGRVAGVLQASEESTASTVLWFETISIIPN